MGRNRNAQLLSASGLDETFFCRKQLASWFVIGMSHYTNIKQ